MAEDALLSGPRPLADLPGNAETVLDLAGLADHAYRLGWNDAMAMADHGLRTVIRTHGPGVLDRACSLCLADALQDGGQAARLIDRIHAAIEEGPSPAPRGIGPASEAVVVEQIHRSATFGLTAALDAGIVAWPRPELIMRLVARAEGGKVAARFAALGHDVDTLEDFGQNRLLNALRHPDAALLHAIGRAACPDRDAALLGGALLGALRVLAMPQALAPGLRRERPDKKAAGHQRIEAPVRLLTAMGARLQSSGPSGELASVKAMATVENAHPALCDHVDGSAHALMSVRAWAGSLEDAIAFAVRKP